MLSYLALGVALTASVLLLGHWFVAADPKNLVKTLKWFLIIVIGAVVVFFTATGRLGWAFAALPALIPWFLRFHSATRMARNFARMAQSMNAAGGGGDSGRTSDVETKFLRMALNHDSGIISGEVIAGAFSGRSLGSMTTEELLRLRDECDKPSVQVLEAYLDRAHKDWRQQAGREGEKSSAFAEGAMSRDEALRILGLTSAATPDEIKDAHRRLIAGIHPDHGGSTYLAAKINQAKDALLG